MVTKQHKVKETMFRVVEISTFKNYSKIAKMI